MKAVIGLLISELRPIYSSRKNQTNQVIVQEIKYD